MLLTQRPSPHLQTSFKVKNCRLNVTGGMHDMAKTKMIPGLCHILHLDLSEMGEKETVECEVLVVGAMCRRGTEQSDDEWTWLTALD
jgi:hypothetical protein